MNFFNILNDIISFVMIMSNFENIERRCFFSHASYTVLVIVTAEQGVLRSDPLKSALMKILRCPRAARRGVARKYCAAIKLHIVNL